MSEDTKQKQLLKDIDDAIGLATEQKLPFAVYLLKMAYLEVSQTNTKTAPANIH